MTFILTLLGVGLALGALGWAILLNLSFRLEKERFGWSEDEALVRFVSLRRAADKRAERHMRSYINDDLRAFAHGMEEGGRYRLARWSLRLGYGLVVIAGLAWFGQTLLQLW